MAVARNGEAEKPRYVPDSYFRPMSVRRPVHDEDNHMVFEIASNVCPEELGFRKCKYKRQMRGQPSFCSHLGREHAWLTGFVEGRAVTADSAQYNTKLSLAIASDVRGQL